VITYLKINNEKKKIFRNEKPFEDSHSVILQNNTYKNAKDSSFEA